MTVAVEPPSLVMEIGCTTGALPYDAAEVNVTHLQGGCCSGALGYREAHIRLRGLATVVGDHQGGGVGALREIA